MEKNIEVPFTVDPKYVFEQQYGIKVSRPRDAAHIDCKEYEEKMNHPSILYKDDINIEEYPAKYMLSTRACATTTPSVGVNVRDMLEQQYGIKVSSPRDAEHIDCKAYEDKMNHPSILDKDDVNTEEYVDKYALVPQVHINNLQLYDGDKYGFDFRITGHLYEFTSQKEYIEYLIVNIKHSVGEDEIYIERSKYYTGLAHAIHAQCPNCQIKDENKEFPRLISDEYINFINSSDNNIQFKFNFGGWFRLPSDFPYQHKKLFFLHNGIDGVNSDYRLIRNKAKARDFLMNFLQLSASTSKLILCLIFMAYAPLARFFSEAGIRTSGLNVVLFLSAYTGTGKTTLSSILSKAILDDNVKEYARFEDTLSVLIEQSLGRKDAPILVDDYYMVTNVKAKREQQEKLDYLTRMVGDGIAKTVLGPNRKPIGDREYFGVVIMTGELRNLQNQSSYLRNWRMHFSKGELRFSPEYGTESPGSILRRDNSLGKAFISEWIAFLEVYQEQIIMDLPQIVNMAQSEALTSAPSSAHSRFYSNITAMLSVAKLLDKFLQRVGFGDILNYSMMKSAISIEATEQHSVLEDIDPINVFINAIIGAIENAKISILPNKESFRNTVADGFYEVMPNTFDALGKPNDCLVYIINSSLKRIINDYANEQQYGVELNTTMIENLVAKGIVIQAPPSSKDNKPSNTHKYSVNRSVAPSRPTLYKINLGGRINE